MHTLTVCALIAGLIEVTLCVTITDFSKVDFIKEFKTAEARGGLSPLEMQGILQAHNYLRRELANGRRERMPKAANLPILEWDDRLAYEALLWADHVIKTNSFAHPSSIPMDPWGDCGQNLGRFSTRNMLEAMKGFDSEINFYTFDTNVCKPTGSYYTCGHAKQLYYGETTHVGCQGRSSGSNIVIVCNYGPQPQIKGIPYTKGTPCSACKGSYPFCLDGLCASKKVCELAGMDKCKCTKTDSQCGHGASVDPATCQCTKNCPAEWVSPFCKSKCDDGAGMEGMCSQIFTTKEECVGSLLTCAKYCGTCVERVRTIGVAKASNVLGLESYPRAKNCEDVKGLKQCASTSQDRCGVNNMIAAACPRTCNRCRMLDGVTNWSRGCTPKNKPKCATIPLFVNVCQKLCA